MNTMIEMYDRIMSCLKRLSNMMVGLNVNLTTTNGHCMLQ